MLDFSVTFIITILNIIILYFILRKILWKPVTKFMAERSKKVRDSIEQSENDKARAEVLLAEYEDKLKNAEAEAEEIFHAARAGAEAEAEEIIAKAKIEAERFLAAARIQLEVEHQAALVKFRAEAAALVIAASSSLAGRELGSDDNRRYASMLLEELQKRKN